MICLEIEESAEFRVTFIRYPLLATRTFVFLRAPIEAADRFVEQRKGPWAFFRIHVDPNVPDERIREFSVRQTLSLGCFFHVKGIHDLVYREATISGHVLDFFDRIRVEGRVGMLLLVHVLYDRDVEQLA